MKFCQQHWGKLRQTIKSLGAWDLVATSGEEALAQITDELKGAKKTLESYDPLMTAHNMLTGRALETGGVYLLMSRNPDDPDGHYCPLCELEKHSSEEIADSWIDGAAKAAVDHAKTLPRKNDHT